MSRTDNGRMIWGLETPSEDHLGKGLGSSLGQDGTGVVLKKLLFPLNFAILLAAILGSRECVDRIRDQDYIGYHLYNTAFRVLASAMNRHVLVMLLIVYVSCVLIGAIWELISDVFASRPYVWLVTGVQLIAAASMILFLMVNTASIFLSARAETSAAAKPNVILIIVDTLRTDELGCYGYFRNTTPSIDKLASDGLRFSSAYAQAPWTRWSIASFLTSRYPETMNLKNFHQHGEIDDSFLTLAEIFKDQGYATSAIVSRTAVTDLSSHILTN